MTNVNVILGSIRSNSLGSRLLKYLEKNQKQLEAKSEAKLNFIKVSDYKLEAFNLPNPPMSVTNYPNDIPTNAQKWVKDVSNADGLLFLVPEYDFSIPGAFKNALDYLGSGLNNKPVQTISYSSGSFAGILSSMALQPVFQVLNLISLPHNMRIKQMQNIFAEDGEFSSDLSEKEQQYYANRIESLVQNIAHYANILK